jgi:adenosine deaminase
LMSNTSVTRELHLCHRHYGWSLRAIKEIIIAGFKSAFMPYREKSDLVAEVNRELAQYEDPRDDVGRVGLVESEPPPAPAPSTKPKLVTSS